MGTKQLTELDDEFQALTNDVKAHAEQLVLIEDAKSRLAVDDPRRLSLSQRAQDVAADLLVKTAAETAMVQDGSAPVPRTATDRLFMPVQVKRMSRDDGHDSMATSMTTRPRPEEARRHGGA